MASSQLLGVVLCKVGDHRLAVSANDVSTVDICKPGALPGPSARRAFRLEEQAGRVLLTDDGEALVVDQLEVLQMALPVLPTPKIVQGGVAGVLEGFVLVREHLWPLVRLGPFVRFVETLAPVAGAARDAI